MESKKFIIITISIILLGSMGTFVFASRLDSFSEEDINYKKEEQPVKKVETPNPPTVVDPDPIVDDDETKTPNEGSNSVSSNKVTNKPKPSVPNNGSNTGSNTTNNNGNNSNNNGNGDYKGDPIGGITTEIPNKPDNSDKEPDEDQGEELTVIVTTSNNNGHKQTFRDITVTIVANREIMPVDGWNLDETKTILTKTFGKNELVDNNGKIIPMLDKPLVITGSSDKKETTIYYSIENYDPNCPEVEISRKEDKKGNVTTTITQIFDRPLSDDGSWVYNDEVQGYVKIEVIEGDNNGPFVITLPDGSTKVFENTLTLDVLISNYDEETKIATPTNKPVKVTINSNNEISDIEEWIDKGWNVTNNNKTLEKEFVTTTIIQEYIYDLAGNSVYIDKKVENIDMTPAVVKTAKVNKGNIEIRLDDFILLPEGWYSKVSTNIKSIYKPLDEFSTTKEEIVTFKDRFGNVSKYKIVLNDDNTIVATVI